MGRPDCKVCSPDLHNYLPRFHFYLRPSGRWMAFSPPTNVISASIQNRLAVAGVCSCDQQDSQEDSNRDYLQEFHQVFRWLQEQTPATAFCLLKERGRTVCSSIIRIHNRDAVGWRSRRQPPRYLMEILKNPTPSLLPSIFLARYSVFPCYSYL